jgi:hypothetical protein
MDDVTLRELQLFTENDADIYRQRTTPIVRNLRTKQAQGKYDHDRAVDLFMYLAEAGARKYAREHGGGEAEWNVIFPKDVRRAAAAAWRDEFEQESALGNYDSETYLPKKYLHGKCIEPGCPNSAVGPHGLCTRHIAELKKPYQAPAKKTRTKTPHSEAYYAGMRAGREYADQQGASRSNLSDILETTRRMRPDVLAANKNTGDVAEFLGLPRKASMTTIKRAYQEFDDGFERGAISVLDAVEGN